MHWDKNNPSMKNFNIVAAYLKKNRDIGCKKSLPWNRIEEN